MTTTGDIFMEKAKGCLAYGPPTPAINSAEIGMPFNAELSLQLIASALRECRDEALEDATKEFICRDIRMWKNREIKIIIRALKSNHSGAGEKGKI